MSLFVPFHKLFLPSDFMSDVTCCSHVPPSRSCLLFPSKHETKKNKEEQRKKEEQRTHDSLALHDICIRVHAQNGMLRGRRFVTGENQNHVQKELQNLLCAEARKRLIHFFFKFQNTISKCRQFF